MQDSWVVAVTDKFGAAGFPSTSKSSICWDPLQILGAHDERSESVIDDVSRWAMGFALR